MSIRGIGRRLGILDKNRTLRQGMQPYVVEIPSGVIRLEHSTRRPSDRSDPKTFVRRSRRAQLNDRNGHRNAPCIAPERLRPESWRPARRAARSREVSKTRWEPAPSALARWGRSDEPAGLLRRQMHRISRTWWAPVSRRTRPVFRPPWWRVPIRFEETLPRRLPCPAWLRGGRTMRT